MPETTLNGPVVKTGVHNTVLRDVLMHTPTTRLPSETDYYVISVGIREGDFTSWVGSWDQSTQKIVAATSQSVLDEGRQGMRLKEKQALVVKITSSGSPATIEGSRLNFQMGLVGGRVGELKPLVAAGAQVTDANSRVALSALERQVNTGGLSDWEESVQLRDSVAFVEQGTFGGRIQRDSATEISLQRYAGNWVEVDGEAVSITSDGLSIATTDELLSSEGGLLSSTPGVSTLYYVYVGSDGLRLSATAPSLYLGTYYLGSDAGARAWRFCGWVRTSAATQFTDSETAREVVNYYNRQETRLYTCPAYNDGNAWTTYTMASTTWAKVNGGTGSDVTFIYNGEDVVRLHAHMRGSLNLIQTWGCGIGIDGVTDVENAALVTQPNTDRKAITCTRAYDPGTVGRHTASLLGLQVGGTLTIFADAARYGATADTALTYLVGWVMT